MRSGAGVQLLLGVEAPRQPRSSLDVGQEGVGRHLGVTSIYLLNPEAGTAFTAPLAYPITVMNASPRGFCMKDTDDCVRSVRGSLLFVLACDCLDSEGDVGMNVPSSPLVCPRCQQNDRIEKVSTLVSSGG